MRLKAAVIGCGMAGSQYDETRPKEHALSHAGAYWLNRDVDLIALCDIDKDRLKDAHGKWEVHSSYDSYKDMLEAQDIDILSICSSTETHLDMLNDALDKGVSAVFLEKPISYDFQNAVKLNKKIREGKTKVAINYRRRWDPTMIRFKEMFDTGALGRVQKITCLYTKGIIHIASHAIDMVRWFFGEPVSVVALDSLEIHKQDAVLDVCFKMKPGFNFYLQGFDSEKFNIFEIDIVTEKVRIRILKGGRQIQFYELVSDPVYRHLKLLERGKELVKNESRFMASNAVSDLVNVVRTKQEPRCTYEDGLRALELSVMAIRSAQDKGKEIRIY